MTDSKSSILAKGKVKHVKEERNNLKQAKFRANIDYKRRYFKSALPSVINDNHLQKQFVVGEPDEYEEYFVKNHHLVTAPNDNILCPCT